MAAASGSFPRSGLTARSPVLPVATRNPATPLRSVPPAPTSAPDPIEQAEFSHYEDSGGISGRPGSRDSGETTLSTRMRLQEAATTIAEQSDKIRNLREQVERLNQVYDKTGTERPLSNIASGIASGNVTTSRGGRSNLSTSAPTLRENPSGQVLPRRDSVEVLSAEPRTTRARQAYGFENRSYVPPENRVQFAPLQAASAPPAQVESQQETTQPDASVPGPQATTQTGVTQDASQPSNTFQPAPDFQTTSGQYGYYYETPHSGRITGNVGRPYGPVEGQAAPNSNYPAYANQNYWQPPQMPGTWQQAQQYRNPNHPNNQPSTGLQPAPAFYPTTPNQGNVSHGPPVFNSNAPPAVASYGFMPPNPSGGPGGGGPGPYRSPDDNRFRRGNTADSTNSHSGPKLKVSDIGYWDPRHQKDTKDDEKSNRLRIPVELFVKRLDKLGRLYGENAVVSKLDAALVNVSSWLLSLSFEDEERCRTLDGYISILLRDWSEPDVISRERAREYCCSDAKDSLDFYIEKLSRLRIGGIDREVDQYYEMWISLPARWRATIPMQGSLPDMKKALRQQELALGWPSSRKSSFGSDSGYESNVNKRQTGSGQSRFARSDRFNDRSNVNNSEKTFKNSNDKRPIPYCLICKELGKGEHRHWHRDCPNQSAGREKVNALKSIEEALNEGETSEKESEAESHSSSDDSEPERSTEEPISRVYSDAIIQSVKLDSFTPRTFENPQVFHSSFKSSSRFGSGDIFRDHGPVHIYIRSSTIGPDTRVCADTGCGPSIGNRKLIRELFPNAAILTRECHKTAPLRVRGGFNGKEYEYLPNFVAVDVFLVTTKGNLLCIKAEIHLSDASIDSGILIGSSTLATNNLSLDFRREVLLARRTDQSFSVRVPFYVNDKHRLVDDMPVRATADLTIPPDHEGLVRVDLENLPNRTFIFEGRRLGKGENKELIRCADSAVDSSVTRVMIANMSETPFRIKRGKVIGYISEMRDDWTNTVREVNSVVSHRPWFSKDFV